MCASSICSDCQVKRRLSKTDAEVYPVCIHCDFELTNSHQLQLYNEVVVQREELINEVTMLVEQAEQAVDTLTLRKKDAEAELKREQKRMEGDLQNEKNS